MSHPICNTLAFCGLGLVLAACAAEAEKKEAPKLEVREFKAINDSFRNERPQGLATKPTPISNGEELAKAIPEKEVQAQLKKDVDFAKEQLLFFAWAGSGMDQLTWKVEEGKKGPEVVFQYQRGRTRDLRSHFRLYGVPKGTTWSVRTAEQ